MNLRQGLTVLAQASAWLAPMIAAPALAQTVGVNAAVRNLVTMNSPDNPAPRPAVVKQRVMVGNQVTTGAASALLSALEMLRHDPARSLGVHSGRQCARHD